MAGVLAAAVLAAAVLAAAVGGSAAVVERAGCCLQMQVEAFHVVAAVVGIRLVDRLVDNAVVVVVHVVVVVEGADGGQLD